MKEVVFFIFYQDYKHLVPIIRNNDNNFIINYFYYRFFYNIKYFAIYKIFTGTPFDNP